ncbi:DNA methylase [Micractinium conductrix]|uniref:DNA methylase n=1 Tax=Micractinium conductrix TaxID=554055 RepID=A0A2P6VRZ3_9CHLO|nr:DNA methylase [Micractinium conductrix]|eukprot:PSC76859.1 DNA methylase [Micractinium conductrix]
MHVYYATCHPGLEEVVAAELRSANIGAVDVQPGKAGVSFTGELATGYRANLWLRSAIRVLQLLAETVLEARQPAGEEVYAAFRETADWTRLLAPGQSFSVDSRVWSCSNLSSSQLLSVRAKDAICDVMRDARGSKPLPPEPGRVAALPLYCTAYHDRLTIYRDMSGASLHRRGYRQAMHRASLNEAAAAGMLYLSGWHELCRQEGAVLCDPMCGSGTFLIEGALMANNIAPGSFRRWWPFTQWPDFDKPTWLAASDAAAAAAHDPPTGVEAWGNDVHEGALSLALRDVQAAGVSRSVRLHRGDCLQWVLPRRPALVVANPPWGQRLGGGRGDGATSFAADSSGASSAGDESLDWWNDEASAAEQARAAARRGGRDEQQQQQREAAALAGTWYDLSTFLKQQCPGTSAYLLSGNPEASTGLRMKASRRLPITVGGVDCRLLKYDIRAMPEKAAA